jgi:hypothetical protein
MMTPKPCTLHVCVRRASAGVALLMLLTLPLSATGPMFFPDDPIAREPDPADASRVQPFPVHLSWDLLSSLIVKEGDPTRGRARNVNSIDEVPDSNWFTNRVGSRPMSVADVARGPDTTDGPVGRWTVVSGKSEGVRPGFTIRDAAGIQWFIKFDAPGYPEQATGAEVVATKLFWALGYNVAETHVATIRREDLMVGPDATVTVHRKRRRLTAGDVDRVLALADRSPDGAYRALASKALDGRPVGEFLYYGTRADDPNDVVPHENRRELRAMGVFAAWIDRVDAKAGNTLDTLVTADGDRKTVVRHHVLDFGSTLGSGGVAPNEPWEGYEYLVARKPLLKKLFGFGFPVEDWRTIHYPNLRGVGRIEADHFNPESWRSRVPNAAYLKAQPDDTFWAARKVMAVTEPMIVAAVKSGKYSDPAAEDYLVRTLVGRRNAIGRAFLNAITPIVSPALDDTDLLTFHNAAVDSDVATAPSAYRIAWYRFDNATGDTAPLGVTETRSTIVQGPSALRADGGAFVRVDISALAQASRVWVVPVRAYFHRSAEGWTLIGLERSLSTPRRASAIKGRSRAL